MIGSLRVWTLAGACLLLSGCLVATGARTVVEQPGGVAFTMVDQEPFPVPANLKDHQIYVHFDKSPRLTSFFRTRLAKKGFRMVDKEEEATYKITVMGSGQVRAFIPGFIANYRIYQQGLAYLAETGEPICATQCDQWKAFSHQAAVMVVGGTAGVAPAEDAHKLGLRTIGVADDMPALMMDDLVKVVLDRMVARLGGDLRAG